MAFLTGAALGAMVLAGGLSPVLAGPAERHSGTVVKVNPAARTLVVDELGALGKQRKLNVRVTPQAQVILSKRVPDDQAQDPRHPFKDTPVSLSDLRPGDFVTVEMGKGKTASSVTVTFRR